MRKRIRFLIYILIVSVSAFSSHVQAQTPPPEEMSLEEELESALQEQDGSTMPIPQEDASLEDEMSLSEEDPAGGLISPVEAELTQPPVPEGETSESERVRELAPRYLMNGYSFGVEVWQHKYDIKSSLFVQNGSSAEQEIDISSSSADFQSVGGKLRYAILPYDAIGADLNVTAGTSLNHGSNGFASIHTLRGEFNLAYTFDLGGAGGFYILGGAGYEILFGEDIEKIVSYGGAGTAQAGGGISFGSFSAELMYIMGFHRLSGAFIENAGKQAQNQGATSYRGGSTKVTAQMISGRLMFAF